MVTLIVFDYIPCFQTHPSGLCNSGDYSEEGGVPLDHGEVYVVKFELPQLDPCKSIYDKVKLLPVCHYRPQRSCGQGNVFTGVCDSVHRGGVCLSACWDTTTPRSRHPLGAGTPLEQTPPGSRHTPWSRPPKQTPPPPGADTLPPRSRLRHIRSMSGRYASYWNAFLFFCYFY